MSQLQGKVAIVTGASKGIGAGIAKGLGAAGAAVVVNYASSKEGADRVVAEITRKGGTAIAVQGDVSRAADVQRLFAETQQAFGAVDVLVNNAGVYQFDPLEAVTEAEFDRKIRVNSINPGGVETEGVHRAGITGSDFEKQMIAGTPLGRLGQPEDIAPIAVFLASEDSGWLTGETLVASGGFR